MGDEEATTATTEDDSTEEDTPAWYRDQIDRKDKQLKDQGKTINRQRVHLMADTFEKVGLDPEKGLGKAIAEKYEGDPNEDDLRNFAIEEYSWEAPVDDSMQTTITDAQGRVTTATAEATSQPQTQIDLEIAEAEERGDFAASVALKVRKFRTTQGI